MKLIKYTLLVAAVFLSTLAQARQHNFLWVMDNSASMERQRHAAIASFEEFLRLLKRNGIDQYSMGITATDYFSYQGYLAHSNHEKIIKHTDRDPVKLFAKIMEEGVIETTTSFWEQGLESSLQVLKGKDGKPLLQAGVPLSIIYISDEDDYSCKDNCAGAQPEDNDKWEAYPIERYVRYFKSLKVQSDIEVSVFPIVGLFNGSCKVSSYGLKYLALMARLPSKLSEAHSVCEGTFPISLFEVANAIGKQEGDGPMWVQDPIRLQPAVEWTAFHADLVPFCVGRNLKFTMLRGPRWLNLSHDGQLSGTPSRSDVGRFTVRVRATDSNGKSSEADVLGVVVKSNSPPVWPEDMVSVFGPEGESFEEDLAQQVSDHEGDPLTFRTRFLPPGFTLEPNGMLRGVFPSAGRAITFTVVASDGKASSTGHVEVMGTKPY